MKLIITENKKNEMLDSLVDIRNIAIEAGVVNAEKVPTYVDQSLGGDDHKKFIGGEMNFTENEGIKTLEIEVSEETFAFAIKAAHKAAKILKPVVAMAKAMAEVITNVRKDFKETWDEMTREYQEDLMHKYEVYDLNLETIGVSGGYIIKSNKYGEKRIHHTWYVGDGTVNDSVLLKLAEKDPVGIFVRQEEAEDRLKKLILEKTK